ncbi:MAG: riboflavin synthase [Muribaculaceae bacterium]|nr:riboflavin synthase [Muribaculaceae bacterium]
MFSGIVEAAAKVVGLRREQDNLHLTLECDFADELHIDQSVAHNGVCLTVVELLPGNRYVVTAIRETLDRSNLGLLKEGDLVNVERSMKIDGRLDGHIVQGHVDCTAECIELEEANGSTYFKFRYAFEPALAAKGYVTVEKGSVTVNGVSLTVCDSESDSFRVAIIPYTMEHTNFCQIQPGTIVNLEFDIVGKYIARISALS